MNQNKSNLLIAAALIIIAAVLKVATYHNSFSMTPIIAIAFFSGAVITDKKLAFIIPLLAMFAADLLLEVTKIGPGFYGFGQIGNYVCLLFVALLGSLMKKISIINVVAFSIASTLLFYFLSNTNAFIFDTFNTYSRNFQGYMDCLTAGIPFLKSRLITDLVWSAVLFGSYVLVFKSSTKKAIA